MRLLKWYVVVMVIMFQAIAGCGGGGSSSGVSTGLITSSISTAVSVPTAVSTISISGVSSPLVCGIDLRVTYPNGTTFVSVVASGIAQGSLITEGTVGVSDTNISIATLQGFGSGEIAKINYDNVPLGSISANFGVSVLRVLDCSGNQIQ